MPKPLAEVTRAPIASLRRAGQPGGPLWTGLWFLVTPLVLTGLTLHFLVPGPTEAASTPLESLRRLAETQTGPVLAGTYLFFLFIARAWREDLPGRPGLDAAPAAAPAAAASGRARRVASLVATVAGAALAAVILRGGIAEASRVVSTSMVPTLRPGDRMLVDKRAYGLRVPFVGEPVGARPPRRGDVVVFRAGEGQLDPGADPESAKSGLLVKRVLGLPGDRVTMLDGHPVINGKQVPSCDAGTFVYLAPNRFSRGRLAVEFLDGQAWLAVLEPGPRSFAGYTVPEGEVFVLGDNRGVSNDSRSWNAGRGGGVPVGRIEGQVRRVLFGTDRGGTLDVHRLAASIESAVLELPGVDIAALRAGIARCLASPHAS